MTVEIQNQFQIAFNNNQDYRHIRELKFFDYKQIHGVLALQKTHPNYNETPLISLNRLAKRLSIGEIHVKNESKRFGLNAFKVLGGIFAIAKYISKKLNIPLDELSFKKLQQSSIKNQIGDITFISATDGNHGRGVAWAARELGQHAKIFLPKGSTKQRLEAIQREGAYAEITDLNYDDCVRLCSKLAEENGWVMIQDTSWEGYEEIPLWIMQGYASIAQEIINELEQPPTHVFLQAGVGSFAAAIIGYFIQNISSPIRFFIVEPKTAACYFQSFKEGKLVHVGGELNSIMAGLACGEPNPFAYKIIGKYAEVAIACEENVAATAMRIYANPLDDDPKIIAGESGAATLGALYALCQSEQRQALGLDEEAKILLINTEGNTDEQSYQDIIWKGKFEWI